MSGTVPGGRSKRPLSKRAKRRKELLKTIKIIFESNHKIYGAPRITKALPEGRKACKGTVAKLMRENGIRPKTVKKFKATTDSNHTLPVAENILNRDFKAARRNEKWVSDITYIWCLWQNRNTANGKLKIQQ